MWIFFYIKLLEITVLHIFINNSENISHWHIQFIPGLFNLHRQEGLQKLSFKSFLLQFYLSLIYYSFLKFGMIL